MLLPEMSTQLDMLSYSLQEESCLKVSSGACGEKISQSEFLDPQLTTVGQAGLLKQTRNLLFQRDLGKHFWLQNQ